MTKQPCEVVVMHILPSIRAELAKKLVEDGHSQQQVSEILNVTPAAISQYLSGKRGYEIDFDKDVSEEIGKAAGNIKNMNEKNEEYDKLFTFSEICGVCHHIRESESFCIMEDKHEVSLDDCDECRLHTVCNC